MQGLRKQIFDLLTGSPLALAPTQIAQRLGQDKAQVRVVLRRMMQAEPPQVSRDQLGSYSYPV